MNTFQITSQLQEIYPDIQGELCSKHTVLLNQIQKAYRKTFPMQPPTHYVISKSILQLIKTHHSTISMAMQQGTIIMYSKGQEGGELHISGNVFQDIALEGSGKALNSEKQTYISINIRKMVELATEDLSLNRINGGFIYIYCQDKISDMNIRNSLLICLFMAIISINDLLEEYNQEELTAKLKSSELFQPQIIQAYFLCNKNRQLFIRRAEAGYQRIAIPKKYKFVFLSLSFFNQQFFASNFGNQSEQIVQKIIGSSDIGDFFNNLQAKLKQTQDNLIVQRLNSIKEEFKIKNFIICQRYAIFLVETHRYAELIGKLSKYLHRIHSERTPHQESNGLINRFNSPININALLFSSVPCKALSILDPSDCIWY